MRFNPFGSLPARERARAAIVDLEPLLEFLTEPRAVIQLTGDQGRGKSTHMLALHTHFPNAPYVYLPEDGPLPPIPNAPVLFIDEVQRLPWWRRWLLFRGSATLVLGSHVNYHSALERGRRPVKAIHLSGLDVQRLKTIVNRRLELARRSSGPVPELDSVALESLINRFGDNIRAIENHLYEVYQQLQENGPVRLSFES